MLIKNLFKYWTYQVFAPGAALREKYDAFKSLLAHDKRAHELIAELEEIYYHQLRVDFSVIEGMCDDLSKSVCGIVEDLARVCPSRYSDLRDFFNKIDAYIKFILAPRKFDISPPFAIPMAEISAIDRALVGGKAHNLGAIKRDLPYPVPDGFVITTHAYHYIIESNNLSRQIDDRLAKLDIKSVASLDGVSRDLTEMVLAASIPTAVETAVSDALQASVYKSRHRQAEVCRSEQCGGRGFADIFCRSVFNRFKCDCR